MQDSTSYIGLDVHSRTCTMAWMNGEGTYQGTTTFETSGEEPTARGREPRGESPASEGSANVGEAAYEGDRPPVVLRVEREGKKGGARVIELRRGVDQKSLFESAWGHVESESRIDTDDFSGYGLLGEAYDHRSVDHEETYVTDDGVH